MWKDFKGASGRGSNRKGALRKELATRPSNGRSNNIAQHAVSDRPSLRGFHPSHEVVQGVGIQKSRHFNDLAILERHVPQIGVVVGFVIQRRGRSIQRTATTSPWATILRTVGTIGVASLAVIGRTAWANSALLA